MCTVTRRFILRLAVGLLAFLIGISAAWALGGFNPFQSSSGGRYYRYQRDRRDFYTQPETADMPPVYHKRDRCRAPALSELPPPPPPAPHADAPMPPPLTSR